MYFREKQSRGRIYLQIVESLKRPPKEPDRVYPVVKNQEYDRVYDWED
jgi:hypothetical protein